MGSSPLSVFVSSKMEELAPERSAIKDALQELETLKWSWKAALKGGLKGALIIVGIVSPASA